MEKNDPTPDYAMITTPSELEAFARAIENEKIIAVDLEADSMYHFREKVCLLQMASRQINVLIDPLKLEDLSPLAPVFADPEVQKVFHGADYDIRSLHRDFGIEVNNLFDTQFACRFLGFRETGLEAVLQNEFDITLDKKYQKKDWSQRPLPPDMLEYAARDTTYLIPLAEKLQKSLAEKGRLDWVREECELLSRVRSNADENEPLFIRFKGAGRLRPRNLAILEALLGFRMEIAEKKDRPLFKVFSNRGLLDIVKARPTTLNQLEKTKALSKKQINMYGQTIVNLVKEALKLPQSELPVYPRKKAPSLSPRTPERVKSLKQWRDRRADELKIDPALICTKSQMTTLARLNPAHVDELQAVEEMKTWQRKTFGHEIISTLRRKKSRKNKR